MGLDVGQVLRSVGLQGQGTAVAAHSPATGTITWAQGGLPGGPAVDASTCMYAASVTKQVIAVLAALAVLAGRLDVNAPVRRYLPVLPAWTAGVRVHHLVHHTAALPSTPDLAGAVGVGEEDLDNALVLQALTGVSALDKGLGGPGRRSAYSNTGYVLLAEVLQAVHGEPVAALARRELFAPLEMHATWLGDPAGHLLAGRPRPPRTVGDGGLWTTAADLLTWLRALNSQHWGAPLSELVTTPGHLQDGTVLDHAWGVRVRELPGGTWCTHGGNWPGWAAKTVRVPEQQVAVALVHCGQQVQAVSDAAEELTRRLLPAEPP